MSWTPEADAALRTWDADRYPGGFVRPENALPRQRERLEAMGVVVTTGAIIRRRMELGLTRRRMEWEYYPEALAYFQDHYWHMSAKAIAAKISEMTGHRITASALATRAQREGIEYSTNTDYVCMKHAAAALGHKHRQEIARFCKRIGLRRVGSSRNRYLSPVGFEDLACYMGKDPGWPQSLPMVGQQVIAARSLRAVMIQRKPTFLLRRERYTRELPVIARGQIVGTVIALEPGRVHVASRFGVVVVPPSALEVA